MNALADITPGFADATHGAQQSFRCLLDAMSRPGRVFTWPQAALDGITPPAGLSLGATAALLALLDAETSVHLSGETQAAARYLRFHTGVAVQADAGAAFVVAQASALTDSLWWALALGSDEVPQDGATLVVEVEGLHHGTSLHLTGPGIETTQQAQVAGVPEAFWLWRLDLEAQRPRGVDLVFVHGHELMAVPRSTRLQLQPLER